MSLSSDSGSLQPPLTPRHGRTLRVLGIARISTENQDHRSLDDQEALYRGWLDQHAGFPYELKRIAGKGSGEDLLRPELWQALREVETDHFDLVITEDLARICRRSYAADFCGICLDHGTRLIALNDDVDTGRDGWNLNAFFATMRHEMYNADTSKRIRRSLRNRFQQGGVVQTVVYGYVKPAGAKTDAELQKDPAAEPVYVEIFRRLEDGATYSEVADWLNEQRIKPGPCVRSPRWTCSLVTQLIHNPILKGIRVRNGKMSKRINATGRRKAIPAPPEERLERAVPHLAFIEPERYDRLIRRLDKRNAKFRRRGVDGIDPRKDVPKKRTVWPGQHITCGVCRRPYVYGGNGQKDNLMCRGAHEYRCWNGIAVDGPDSAARLTATIHREIAALPEFDPVFTDLVEEQLRAGADDRGRRHQELVARRATVERQLANIAAAIKATGHSPTLLSELNRLEQEKADISEEGHQLERAVKQGARLPTVADVRSLAEEAFGQLAVASQEFGRLMRRLIPAIVVKPYRLVDGGHPVLRAHFSLALAPLVPDPLPPALDRALQRTLAVDLFDPPEREAFREPVTELAANGLRQREIARKLGVSQAAVQHAAALVKRLQQDGLSDPYVPLEAPPEDYKKLRRHRPGATASSRWRPRRRRRADRDVGDKRGGPRPPPWWPGPASFCRGGARCSHKVRETVGIPRARTGTANTCASYCCRCCGWWPVRWRPAGGAGRTPARGNGAAREAANPRKATSSDCGVTSGSWTWGVAGARCSSCPQGT
jgi:DNA invertase Pin-like site-specific DNA recombinase